MADQSEMARNVIQSDFQTYKMAAEKNGPNCDRKSISEIQNAIDEMAWNGQKVNSDIQNGRRQPFCPKFTKKF